MLGVTDTSHSNGLPYLIGRIQIDAITTFIGMIRPIAELLYFASGIGLVLFAYYGLQQIDVLKKTSAIQAKRDALRLTSEQCTLYFDKIVPLQNEFAKNIKAKNVKYFEGWTIEVKNGSIKVSRKSPANKTGLEEISTGLLFLNHMEAFSVFFTSRVADERIAYDTLGKTFIGTCEHVMPWILLVREDGYYKNIVNLYALWKTRMENERLMVERGLIEEKLSAVKISFHAPIGADFST